MVSLTFDDAPFEPHTSAILKTLDKYNIKATFFVVGKHARTWPNSLKAILSKGHEIGNHTENHLPLGGLSKKAIDTEIGGLQTYLQTRYGLLPRFFRPPQGNISYEAILAINEAGMDLVFWDVDPQDWSSPGILSIARNIATHVRPGSILLLHTLHPQTAEILPVLIEYLNTANYRIVPLSELLDRTPYQPVISQDTHAAAGDTQEAATRK